MAHVDSSARLSGDMYPHTMKKYFKVKGVTRNILVGGVWFFLPMKKKEEKTKQTANSAQFHSNRRRFPYVLYNQTLFDYLVRTIQIFQLIG